MKYSLVLPAALRNFEMISKGSEFAGIWHAQVLKFSTEVKFGNFLSWMWERIFDWDELKHCSFLL